MKESFTWRPAFRACCLNLGLMVAVLLGATPAFALDPKLYFELDGNILSDGADVAGPDWSDVFKGNLPGAGATVKTDSEGFPAGFTSPTFVLDFNPFGNNDNSLFATGSKDTLNITPGWQCKKTNNVSDKTDINNAYAVATTQSGHLIVYFALDVAANEGTKNVGFWFLKDPTVSCEAGNGATAFTGIHSDGDVLIVSEYTSGGRVSTILAYKWVKPVGDPVGYLDTTPIGTGGDCSEGTFDVCARTNGSVLNGTGTGTGDQVPWLVKTKTSNAQGSGYDSATDLDVGEFFEGGIDLTALGISGCFNRYLANTRSATSLTATLFDFALGNFSNCSIGATKSCQTATINSDFVSYTSPFSVVITNTSPGGSVYDVSFNEAANIIPAGETCTIVSNTGDQSVNGTVVTSGGTPVVVTSSLAPNASVTVGLSCTGPANSFQNAIHVTAGSTAGQSDITGDAQVSSTAANACTVAPGAAPTLNKDCQRMVLQAGTSSGAPITLQAQVKVVIANPVTSQELVTITSLSDTKVSGPAPLGGFTQVLCSDLTTSVSDLVLAPNETACFIGSYTPTTADLANPPSAASFSDAASATGVGSLSGTVYNMGPDGATCYLCDTDNDGIPDVSDLSD